MTNTQRYRSDPEFRRRALERGRAYHEANRTSQNYRELVATRKLIWHVKESIAAYRLKIKAARQRLTRLQHQKETLELAFGQERARRKQAAGR